MCVYFHSFSRHSICNSMTFHGYNNCSINATDIQSKRTQFRYEKMWKIRKTHLISQDVAFFRGWLSTFWCEVIFWKGSFIVQSVSSYGWSSTVTPLLAGSGTVTSQAIKRPSEAEAGTACTKTTASHRQLEQTLGFCSARVTVVDNDWTNRPKIPSHALLMLPRIWSQNGRWKVEHFRMLSCR